MLLDWYHDFHVTLRKLGRSAGFAALTVTTFAVGLALNIVLFSILHAVRNPRLPYANPERLVVINDAYPAYGWAQEPTSFAGYRDFKADTRLFAGLAAYSQRRVSFSSAEAQARLAAAVVSSDLWTVIGLEPAIGRAFVQAEDHPGAVPTVIIGDRIWREFFGADPDVLGHRVSVDGIPRTIIAVMPAGLRFPEAEDLWLPLEAAYAPGGASVDDRSVRAWQIVGRLKPDVSVPQVTTELRAFSDRLASVFPESNRGWVLAAIPIAEESFRATGAFFGALQGGGLLLVLIMCGNIGNLLLARGEQRRRELAICASLGASRWRLLRLLLLEVFLLALVGVGLALVLAAWAIQVVPTVIPEAIPFFVQFRIDAVVVAFAVALAFGTALAAGLGGAIRATKGEPFQALSQGAMALVAPFGSSRTRSAFLFVQSAIAAALLAAALVLGFGLMRFHRADLGFDPSNTLLVQVPLPAATYADPQRTRALARIVLDRLAATAGVEAVGISAPLAMSNAGAQATLDIDRSVARPESAPTTYRAVTPQYFRATGSRLVYGRFFSEADHAGAEDVVIINVEAARRFFNTEVAEGRRLRFGATPATRRWRTVVGVVPNTTEQPLDPEIEPKLFVPFDQDPARSLTIAVRTRGNPEAFSRIAGHVVREADPTLAMETPVTAEGRLWIALWPLRFFTGFAAAFSGFGLVVACSGVYGLTRYLTLARTREIALRLALGGSFTSVMLLIARQNGTPLAAGVMIGLGISVGISNMLQHVLLGLPAVDVLALIVAATALACAGTLAILMPALHVRRVHPAEALRNP